MCALGAVWSGVVLRACTDEDRHLTIAKKQVRDLLLCRSAVGWAVL